jgi:hypothetical protein
MILFSLYCIMSITFGKDGLMTDSRSNSSTRKRGAPLGNHNALGHGAPPGNQNALKHGIYCQRLVPLEEGCFTEDGLAGLDRQAQFLDAILARLYAVVDLETSNFDPSLIALRLLPVVLDLRTVLRRSRELLAANKVAAQGPPRESPPQDLFESNCFR